MSLVGGANFAALYEDENGRGTRYFQESVWVPAFLKVRNKYRDINTVFMGFNYTSASKLIEEHMEVVDIGYFPINIKNIDRSKTLFVNVWDPWSFVGNGNENDRSLDGFIGRCTMAGLLCFPVTSIGMTYQCIE